MPISDETRQAIRERLRNGDFQYQYEVAEEIGVSEATVTRVKNKMQYGSDPEDDEGDEGDPGDEDDTPEQYMKISWDDEDDTERDEDDEYECGNCGTEIEYLAEECPNCGEMPQWDDMG